MLNIKFIKIYLVFLICSTFVCGEDSINTQDLLKKATIYEPTSRGGYLGLSSGIVIVSSLVVAGVLFVVPESVSKWNRDEMKNLFKNYRKKVSSGPVVDNDELWLNYIAHPYIGALYYLQPRMAGFSWAESALFSFGASTFFWEYGIEGFAEIPSWQDIIITPAIGSLLGEGFYRLIYYIQSNDNELFGSWWLGKIVVWLLDPLGNLIYSTGFGELFGIYNKNELNKKGFISTPILPTKDGLQISFIYRF